VRDTLRNRLIADEMELLLAIAAWERNPQTFGIRGFERRSADMSRVANAITADDEFGREARQ
jgi:hypothetical protein